MLGEEPGLLVLCCHRLHPVHLLNDGRALWQLRGPAKDLQADLALRWDLHGEQLAQHSSLGQVIPGIAAGTARGRALDRRGLAERSYGLSFKCSCKHLTDKLQRALIQLH
jgi:hypothetical protein